MVLPFAEAVRLVCLSGTSSRANELTGRTMECSSPTPAYSSGMMPFCSPPSFEFVLFTILKRILYSSLDLCPPVKTPVKSSPAFVTKVQWEPLGYLSVEHGI